jgi:hypothetical protein
LPEGIESKRENDPASCALTTFPHKNTMQKSPAERKIL